MANITKSDVLRELDRLNNIMRTEEDITLCRAADEKKAEVIELLQALDLRDAVYRARMARRRRERVREPA